MKKLSLIIAIAAAIVIAFNFYSTSSTAKTASTEITSPLDGATNVAVPVTITWNAVMGAINYRLQVDDNSDFSSPAFDSDVSGTSQSVSGLSANTVYYVHARDNQLFPTSFGSTISFRTAQ